MAVSLGTLSEATGLTGTTCTLSHTHTAGRELLVLISGRLTSNTCVPASVTYDGVGMTEVVTSPASGAVNPFSRSSVWRLADPGSKTANVVLTWSTANNNYTTMWAVDIVGSKTGASLIDSSGSGAATAFSVAVTHTRGESDTFSLDRKSTL